MLSLSYSIFSPFNDIILLYTLPFSESSDADANIFISPDICFNALYMGHKSFSTEDNLTNNLGAIKSGLADTLFKCNKLALNPSNISRALFSFISKFFSSLKLLGSKKSIFIVTTYPLFTASRWLIPIRLPKIALLFIKNEFAGSSEQSFGVALKKNFL